MIFQGIRREIAPSLINAMTSSKMLRKVCQGYLAFVVDRRQKGTWLEDIPIVKEFPDVFQMIFQVYLQIERGSSPLI